MRRVLLLIRGLLGRRRPAPRRDRPLDPEQLQQIYRETQRHLEALRRAA